MTDIFGMTPRFYSGGGWEWSCVNGRLSSMDWTLRNLRDRGGIETAFFFSLYFLFPGAISSREFNTQAGL